MTTHLVQLYIYDLSKGIAARLSPIFLDKQIDGIWHTSIVVYNREYFFGSSGIESCNPGCTALQQPLKIENLGETQVPYTIFIDYLNGLSQSSYSGHTYNLLSHNCNNFSNEVAQFLCGASIPKYILDLPEEIKNSRIGVILLELAKQLESSARPIQEEEELVHSKDRAPDDYDQLNTQIEEARSDFKVNGQEKNV